jgi:hypothetical protein
MQLLPPGPWFRRDGAYPIIAYSEFMPPPPLGRRAYGGSDPLLFTAADPWGWQVTEYEETFELRPGLEHLAGELLGALRRLGRREGGHGIGRRKLDRNPAWPEPLAGGGAPAHERYLALLPLALARTQDDKGRVRWSLFGASEQGPARAFWRGFFTAPGCEADAAEGLAFCRRLLGPAAALPAAEATRELLAAGFRILAGGGPPERDGIALPDEGPLPSWTAPLLWSEEQPLGPVRHLLAFRPFAWLPEAVRGAYLAGSLELLPFPGSLLFWTAPPYQQLARELPLAQQIPLLHPIQRSEDPHRLRVPQSGWLHEPHTDHPHPQTEHGPMRETFRRTHRWGKIERHQDELAVAGHEDRMAHVLFSAAPDDIGLYGKPMGRNCQIWTHDYRLLLDGPRASRSELAAAAGRLAAGGTFGYRFLYPAMRVGRHEVYWHRLLAAVAGTGRGRPEMIAGAPLGYLTAYPVDPPDYARPVELWPRLLDRPAHRAAIDGLRGGRFTGATAARLPAATDAGVEAASAAAGLTPADYAGYRRTLNNARKLLDAWQLLGSTPLPASFAQALLRLPRKERLAEWLTALERVHTPGSAPEPGAAPAPEPALAAAPAAGPGESAAATPPVAPADPVAPAAARTVATLVAELRSRIALPAVPAGAAGDLMPAAGAVDDGAPLTFALTARRRFEEEYWRRIAFLATGRFVNKDNADCVRDRETLAHLSHDQRDLDALAEYLLEHYRRLIAGRGMGGQAAVGDLPFRWQTDFDFTWSGGWLGNQQGGLEERNVMVVIPGRDRGRAVIMADHYDTAYMEDRYGYQHGGHGPRLAAAGADDNHSATVALMMAAPILLDLSRAGRLACDVWLVHLTGEEFPSDCLGARHLARSLVEGTLRLRTRPAAAGAGGVPAAAAEPEWLDLSAARVQGVYVLDMIAHNNDRDRDVFQICPGAAGESMWLALQAHLANRTWNRLAPGWNRRWRRGRGRGRRSADGRTLPALALHPELRGEVRPQIDPHSTLYNTDGQIFSDAGVPVVLFMENYDINRHGYHDSHDTMENIDLDYGAAVAAIAIESVARAATVAPPSFD